MEEKSEASILVICPLPAAKEPKAHMFMDTSQGLRLENPAQISGLPLHADSVFVEDTKRPYHCKNNGFQNSPSFFYLIPIHVDELSNIISRNRNISKY